MLEIVNSVPVDKSMKLTNRFYPESRFGGFTNIDGTIAFYSHINSLIKSTDLLLDIGCGIGQYESDPILFRKNLRILKGKCNLIIGLDVNPEASKNPYIDKFLLIEGNTWPIEDESVDICVCDYVLEHIEYPDTFFKELHRVLKPKGFICIRTTNLLSYIGFIARITPFATHKEILRIARNSEGNKEFFQTYYRINTLSKLGKILSENGFDYSIFGFDSEPSYFTSNFLLYLLGVLHQRFIPGIFKVNIHAYGIKAVD